MKIFGQQRSKAPTRHRGALGLVVVALLNLAFQPCALAMDLDDDHDCPHCPVEATHDAHGAPEPVEVSADCDLGEDVSFDSRTGQAKGSDAPEENVALTAVIEPFIDLANHVGSRFLSPGHSIPPGGPPLNILHCVFLK